jgi:hypothetical protein
VERLEEAEKIRAQALEVLNVAELQSAVSDAEEKIRARHAALAPIPPRAAELVAAWNAHAHAFVQKHDKSDTNAQAALQRELAPLVGDVAVMDACKAAGITAITVGPSKAHGSDVVNTAAEGSPKGSGRTKVDD